jgi:hypothetical protein
MVALRLAAAAILILGCNADQRLTEAAKRLPMEPASAAVLAVVQRATATAPFHGGIRINDSPGSGQAALWLIAPRARWSDASRAVAAAFHENCANIRSQAIVVCDAAFFQDYLRDHTLYPPTNAEIDLFSQWCVGHEFGHLVLDADDDVTSQYREYRADCWFLRNLAPEEWTPLVSLSTNIVSGTIRRAFGPQPAGAGIIYDYNGRTYDFTSDADHPEILMRAIRLLLITDRRRHDPAVTAMLLPFARQMRSDPSWGTNQDLCIGGLRR